MSEGVRPTSIFSHRWFYLRGRLDQSYVPKYESPFHTKESDWESRMVKKFGNNIEDYSEGGLGRCEGAGPSSAPSRDTGDSGNDISDSEKDPE